MSSESAPQKSSMDRILSLAAVAISAVTLWNTMSGKTQADIENIDRRVSTVAERAATLEAKSNAIDGHLAYTDARVNRIEDRVDRK